MILARKLKLTVSQEQHTILIETLEQYKYCMDKVLEYGFTNKSTSGQHLHDATYRDLRNQYPELPSALVCVARVKATEVLKSIKTNEEVKWKRKPLR